MKKFLPFLFLLFSAIFAQAQNFDFGSGLNADFRFNKNLIDSSANAVVLKEFGTSRISLDDATGYLNVLFEYHVRIKIFNKEGAESANIVIPTYKGESRQESISGIVAKTFNESNGELITTEIDRKAIFTENKSKTLELTKFTLPNVKDGSIIEYSYYLQSPFIFNFKTWEFQSDIPKVHSEYVAFIPANYNYNIVLRGFLKLTDQKSELNQGCLRLSGVSLDCSKMTYIMKNVPAFLTEDFMTAESNFKSAMYFELSDEYMMSGAKKSYTKDWKDVDHELITDRSVGGAMKRKDVFKELVPSIIKDETDELGKAKAVYNYIRKQLKWNRYYGISSDDGNIKKILENRTGSVADLNLTLIAALSAANLDAEAVLISTRENGTVNKIYPVISEFNYVVAKVNIGDKSYFLDATEPLSPFGLLPLRCINDQGRVINLKKPSYWVDLKANQRNTTTYMLKGKLTPEGRILGTITTTTLGYAALNKRKEITKYATTEEYVEKLDEQMPKINISKNEIKNIDSLEMPLIESYEIEFLDDNLNKNQDQLFMNPFIVSRITKNPFNLNDRTYPIDLGSALDERIFIEITLPENYVVQEKPKDMAIALPNNGGKYLLQSTTTDNVITFNQLLQLQKAIYPADDYLLLKEFYSRIIQNQKTDVLLKKPAK